MISPKLRKLTSVLYKIKLKNSPEIVLLDDEVYHFLSNDPYLKGVSFLTNLRRHSSGCAVFQKTKKKEDGSYVTKTIYLHKLIAEQFLLEQKTEQNDLVGAVNGNKLDCRLENICWRSRAIASRKRKTSSKTGYTGVYKENNRYRSVISLNRKSIHIGMFDTAEKAALAYNQKSKELFGDDGKLNIINKAERPEESTPSEATARTNKETEADNPENEGE